jgi:hypothetical protein
MIGGAARPDSNWKGRDANMAIGIQVTFDCADPDGLAHFWAAVLDYKLDDPPEGYATWEAFLEDIGVPKEEWNSRSAISDPDGEGPRIFFQQVPEPKSAKNRLHLDVNVGGGRKRPLDERRIAVREASERLIGLGATKLYEHEEQDEYHITMQDPEGNEFCLQ